MSSCRHTKRDILVVCCTTADTRTGHHHKCFEDVRSVLSCVHCKHVCVSIFRCGRRQSFFSLFFEDRETVCILSCHSVRFGTACTQCVSWVSEHDGQRVDWPACGRNATSTYVFDANDTHFFESCVQPKMVHALFVLSTEHSKQRRVDLRSDCPRCPRATVRSEGV